LRTRLIEVQVLKDIPVVALGRRAAGSPGASAPGTGAEIDRVLEAAVADALCSKSAFTRYELIRMIS
jgi:hypothetical protein